jgi:hypothetical protein
MVAQVLFSPRLPRSSTYVIPSFCEQLHPGIGYLHSASFLAQEARSSLTVRGKSGRKVLNAFATDAKKQWPSFGILTVSHPVFFKKLLKVGLVFGAFFGSATSVLMGTFGDALVFFLFAA